jgi:hypothetical protein
MRWYHHHKSRIFSIKAGTKDLLSPSYFPSFLLTIVMLALPLLSLLLATTVFAAPHHKGRDGVPASSLNLPSNQTQLVAPTSAPKYVAVGVGNQNYSCTTGGNYT